MMMEPYCFLQWLYQFAFLPTVQESSFFFTSSPTLVSCVFDVSHSDSRDASLTPDHKSIWAMRGKYVSTSVHGWEEQVWPNTAHTDTGGLLLHHWSHMSTIPTQYSKWKAGLETATKENSSLLKSSNVQAGYLCD
ncbi:uncharacterized protein LOC144303824 [Canis aureus]